MWFLTDNAVFNTIILFCIILFFIFKYVIGNQDYWNNKNIPIKASTIFGNLDVTLLAKKPIGKLFRDMYREYPNTKFLGLYGGRKSQLLIRDPDMIRHVLVKDFHHFQNRSEFIKMDGELMNSSLFIIHGARWKATRQKITPAFTSGKLKNMFPLIVEKIEEFQKFLLKEVKQKEEHEVRDLVARLTTDIIGSIAFGVETCSIENKDSKFRHMGRKIFELSPVQMFKVILAITFPYLSKILKPRIMKKEVEDFFINIVKNIVQQRKSTGIKRNDFIDLMLELRDKGYIEVDGPNGGERIEFSETFMTSQAMLFFAAGFESTSGVMSFALYELAKNPDVQKKLIHEIDTILEKYNGKLCYDAIADMKYLECVTNETMRKYPSLGILTRICGSKYTFPGTDLTIDEDVNIVIPVLGLHYDPQYYPDPYKFLPERFSADAKRDRHPMTYLPFGEGPRICIGLRLGMMESMVAIASVLSKFTVHESPKTESKVTINTRSFVTTCKNGIWLKLKPREDK